MPTPSFPNERALARFEKVAPLVRTSDILFLSIQKSGRTWVRYFLQEYVKAVSGEELSLKPRALPRTTVFPSICFTADYFDFFHGHPGAPAPVFREELLTKPLLLLVRDPRDVVVSDYYFTRRLAPALFKQHVPTGTLAEFLRSPIYGLERISRFHLIELDVFARNSGPKLLVSYEDLWNQPAIRFRQIVEFLSKSPVQDRALSAALEISSFSRMQAYEIEISHTGRSKEFQRLGVHNWSGDSNDLKVRAGGIGGYVNLLPELTDFSQLRRHYPVTAAVLAGRHDSARLND